MKKTLLTILFGLTIKVVICQSLTQDSEGFSTIILPSSNFNLDLADKKANFNVGTYLKKGKKPLKATEAGWLIGGEIKAGVENDLALVFSDGDIASSAEANLLFGRKWFSENNPEKNTALKKLRKEKNTIVQKTISAQDEYEIFLKELLDLGEVDQLLHDDVKFYLTITDEETLKKKNIKLDSLKQGIQNGSIKNRNINLKSFDKIKSKYTAEHKTNVEANKAKVKEINELVRKIYRYRFKKIFVRGGINGTNFKYDLGQDSTTVDSRFEKRNFEGWNAEIGYNVQHMDNHFFGISYEIRRTNNLSDFEEQEFTLTSVDTTITDGQFSNSTTVKAFSGEFDIFNRHSFNFDYVWISPILNDKQKSSNVFLALNPYVRHRVYESSLKLKNNTVLGIALNAFNSEKQKIMGGISIQTNDLFGVHADDDTVLGERISIGLLAKFTFSGISVEKKEKK